MHSWVLGVLLPVFIAGFGQSLQAQDSQLAHWEYGSGSPLVIVLHGGPGVSHDYLLPEWRRMEAFSTVLFYDQRGCGESGGLAGPYGWKEHVADLDALIRDHAEGRPVVLAGSSWGAKLSLLYGLEGKEPIRGFVLSGYSGWWGSKHLLPSQEPLHLFARLDSLEKGLLAGDPSQPDTLSSGNGIGGQKADSIVTSRALRAIYGEARSGILESVPTMPPFPVLVGLEVPVLIISGDDRGRAPDAPGVALATAIHHPTRVIIRDAGHDPWAADPEAFFGAVRAFLIELGLSPPLPAGRGG